MERNTKQTFNYYLCFVCGHGYMWGWGHVSMYVWRPEVDTKCLSLSHSRRSLTACGDQQLSGLPDQPPGLSCLHLSAAVHHAQLFIQALEINSSCLWSKHYFSPVFPYIISPVLATVFFISRWDLIHFYTHCENAFPMYNILESHWLQMRVTKLRWSKV